VCAKENDPTLQDKDRQVTKNLDALLRGVIEYAEY
jgi:hypothetical protein